MSAASRIPPEPSSPGSEPVRGDPRQVFFGLMLVLLLGGLNQTIVAVALPRIAEQFDGFELLAWVVSGYLVSATVVTPIYGKLCDRIGVRRVLIISVSIFSAASLACALAPSMPALVAARVLQGLGGGGLITTAHAGIAQAVSLRERGRYQAYISGVFAVSSVLGPVLGGYITQWLSWPWVFALNLPIAIAAIVISGRTLRRLPVPDRDASRNAIDWIAAALLAAGLAAPMIAVTRAGQGLSWLAPANLAWYAAGLALLALFMRRERRSDDPVVPFHLLGNRVVLLGLVSQLFVHGSNITLTVMVPLELQVVRGMSPTDAALQLIALTLGIPMGGMIAGRLTVTTGRYRPQQIAGTSLTALAVMLLAFSLTGPQWQTTLLLLAAGIGNGLQGPSTTVAVQNAVPHENVGTAVGALNFIRQLGGAVWLALMSTLLLELLRTLMPGIAGAGSGAEVLRQLSAGAGTASSIAWQLQPVAERSFSIVFASCSVAVMMAVACFVALPEKALRT